MFSYVYAAAAEAGLSPRYLLCGEEKLAWESLSILPEQLKCQSSLEAAALAQELIGQEKILFLWANAFSLTPALISNLEKQQPGTLVWAEEQPAALLCTGREAADLLKENGSLSGDKWRKCPPSQLDPLCRWIGTGNQTRLDYHRAAEQLRMAVLEDLMEYGVLIPCTDGVMISPKCKIGVTPTILPGTQLMGRCFIGRDCVIGPNSVITDSVVGDRSLIESSKITQSIVHEGVKIGPFSQLRPNCEIFEGVKIGDFVEVKNSKVGHHTSVAHLTYIGDSDVGSKVNFGCGTVTSNYDGQKKYRTVIGDNAFIGCNTNLIAPVTVGEGAYTARRILP